ACVQRLSPTYPAQSPAPPVVRASRCGRLREWPRLHGPEHWMPAPHCRCGRRFSRGWRAAPACAHSGARLDAAKTQWKGPARAGPWLPAPQMPASARSAQGGTATLAFGGLAPGCHESARSWLPSRRHAFVKRQPRNPDINGAFGRAAQHIQLVARDIVDACLACQLGSFKLQATPVRVQLTRLIFEAVKLGIKQA